MPRLDETRCRQGAPLNRMFTADEASAVKRFLNSFEVRLWNGREPYVDRSNPFGEYTIYIPRTAAGIDYTKYAFGYSLAVDAETHAATCTIYPGTVRIHGIANLALSASVDVVLSGTPSWVYLEFGRPSGSITVAQANAEPESSASTVRLPLYVFTGTTVTPEEGSPYLVYAQPQICHIGDFNFDAPIQ